MADGGIRRIRKKRGLHSNSTPSPLTTDQPEGGACIVNHSWRAPAAGSRQAGGHHHDPIIQDSSPLNLNLNLGDSKKMSCGLLVEHSPWLTDDRGWSCSRSSRQQRSQFQST